jgi:hypothetical protein
MPRITHSRAHWVAIARELAATDRDAAPPGLTERVAALLAATQAEWPDEPCALELDEASAAVVETILRWGQRSGGDSGLAAQQSASLGEADDLIRAHQRASHVYRVEHRAGGRVTILGYSSSADARQSELSRHAARLLADGAEGELVLVEQATGGDVARRVLGPEDR